MQAVLVPSSLSQMIVGFLLWCFIIWQEEDSDEDEVPSPAKKKVANGKSAAAKAKPVNAEEDGESEEVYLSISFVLLTKPTSVLPFMDILLWIMSTDTVGSIKQWLP